MGNMCQRPQINIPEVLDYVEPLPKPNSLILEPRNISMCKECNGQLMFIELLTKNHDSPIIHKYYCKPCGKTFSE